MNSVCPIDESCANEISLLLRPLLPQQVQEYFDQLISIRRCHNIKVKQDEGLGKAVYANISCREGELVFKDRMLVGIQHPPNKIDCFVCSFCFQFIGSIEQQIGRKLYLQNLSVSSSQSVVETSSHKLNGCCDDNASSEEDSSYMEHSENLKNGASNTSKVLPTEVIESLMKGELVLPHSNKFPLPSPILCPGGCHEAYYCSKSCAEADWNTSHSSLCTGEKSESLSREKLGEFIQHANETNDIFLLAAKAISFTIIRYKKLRAACMEEQGKQKSHDALESCSLSTLLEAWKPISVGYKKRWWDCIALPADVDPCDEHSFRMQIRDLAFTSLQLLKAAIFDKECEPLFSLEIYGHIIGMFELNNLDLVVASPVEDYFLYIDELPNSEKKEAEAITQPILDALGDGYLVYCEGTAFFPLQSCINHSCCPNAKAFKREEDRDGQATIVALRSISEGEEITISYVDEDLPFEERQELLADYGFECKCGKCLAKS